MMEIVKGIGRRLALAMMELLTEMVISPYVWVGLLALVWYLFHPLPELFYIAEPGLFAAIAGLVLWRVRCTDRLSARVGTVRRGSVEEQEADKVLFQFDLTERIAFLAMALLIPAFCLSFMMLDTPWMLWLHHAFLALLLVWHYRLYRRLHRIKKARGYGDDNRLA
ncbi:hypothetical protein EDF81_2841 [Enterobacter sp. BIGb0383]|uniref:hypothetical protein n=1 Tax=unclassified Enterobacter TaxID=2608935 RepID=UPI000F490811|nr:MULTISPECIES: hypothetical protein [unclassified Enterobacter]ROP60016.1 hypothetical protein EDF81_2841 [Enterobacter sp. BIGb0383]ROS08516.1 hypothetical protein EC848_1994 [Enterobacter sp. BIGb0359]